MIVNGRREPIGGLAVQARGHPRSSLGPDGREWLAFTIVALAAALAILWLGRYLTFFYDELRFINAPPATVADFFAPWNGHWSTALYATILGVAAVAGWQSYLPFQTALVIAHVLAAAGLFVLVRRRASVLAAFGLTVLFLFLGSAAEDLFWVWQLGFIASTALGLGAMLLVEDARPAAAAAVLVVSTMFSGMGLPFIAACAVLAWVRDRRTLAWIALPALVFVIWRLAMPGEMVVESAGVTPASVIDYSIRLAVGVVGSVTATGSAGGVGFALVVAVVVLRRRASLILVAALVGFASEVLLVAIARSGAPFFLHTRYVYTAAAFLIIAAAELIRLVRHPVLRMLIAAAVILSIVYNAVLVLVGPTLWHDGRYQLPTPFGCVPVAAIADPDGHVDPVPLAAQC